MKLYEVIRRSDRVADAEKEKAKLAAAKQKQKERIAAKEESMRERVIKAYIRGLSAPQYKPHQNDIGRWLFGKGDSDQAAVKELEAWITGVGHMAGANPIGEDPKGDNFRAFSHHINIPGDMVEFVCNGGIYTESDI